MVVDELKRFPGLYFGEGFIKHFMLFRRRKGTQVIFVHHGKTVIAQTAFLFLRDVHNVFLRFLLFVVPGMFARRALERAGYDFDEISKVEK